jgi:methionine-rich copper-binding protein CopC
MRRSRVVVGALLGLLAVASTALGHAVLRSTSLDSGTVVADTPTTVALSFNTAIEPGLSRVLLVDEGRAERVLELLPPDAPGKVVVALPALPPGHYGLRYKVLAADGHVTESVLRFKVTPAE